MNVCLWNISYLEVCVDIQYWRWVGGLSPKMSLSPHHETHRSRLRRWNVRSFQILIVSAVKLCKQCLQTVSAGGHPQTSCAIYSPKSKFLSSPLVDIRVQHWAVRQHLTKSAFVTSIQPLWDTGLGSVWRSRLVCREKNHNPRWLVSAVSVWKPVCYMFCFRYKSTLTIHWFGTAESKHS